MKNFSLLILTIFLHVIPSQLQSCGRVVYTSGTVINGEKAKRGEFPFLVSLFKWKNGNLFVFCGGSLITRKHALTASHCIHNKFESNQLQPEDIIVKLGRYNLKKDNEYGVVKRNVSEIIMHEDWNPETYSYDADIAILVFESEVKLYEYIQTVCLPTSSQVYNLIEGEVVGNGVSEKTGYSTAENIPRKTAIKTLPSNNFCSHQSSLLAQASSNRTFCAGGQNTGPCTGDSGGGFYVQRNSVWYLQGITSMSIIKGGKGRCDVNNFALYTNVASHVTWIEQKISGSKPSSRAIQSNSVTHCCLINSINSDSVKCCNKIPAEKLNSSIQCCDNYPGNFGLVQRCFQNISENSDSSSINCQRVPRN